MTDSDEVTTRHPEDVRVVRETIRHLFPLLDDGSDAADGWSDAYAVVAAQGRSVTITAENGHQDKCHWCGVEFGEDGEETWPKSEAEVSP